MVKVLKRVLIGLLILMFVVPLSACGQSSGTDKTGEISGTSSEPLKVGVICWPTSMFPYVAQEKGYFKDEGLNVEISMFQQSTDAYSAMVTGQLDMCLMGSADAALRYAQGADLQIVDHTEFSNGADGLVATKDIKSVKDLKGKKIATELYSDDHYYLMLLLNEAGLSLDDVEIVNMSIQNSGSAFLAGKVDAASIWEPTLSKTLEDSGDNANLIASTKDNPQLITGAWVSDSETINNRGEDVLKFLTAIHRSLKYYDTDKKDCVKIMSEHLGWDASEDGNGLIYTDIDDTLDLFTKKENNGYTPYKLNTICTFLKELGQIDNVPDCEELIDRRFIDQLKVLRDQGEDII